MAYERLSDTKIANPVKADSLDAFVDTLMVTYKNQLAVRNADDELSFNEMVIAGNMTLDDQLKYRQDQLKRVSDDPTERKRIRGEIANLKDRIEQQKFTDTWAAKLADFQGGLISVDNVIQFLNDTKSGTTDSAILNTVAQKLADMQAQKFTLTQNLIKNSTDYAVNSKNVKVIDDQIKKVQSYKNQAALSGNDQIVSVYDLQLQSLTSAKTAAQVQDDILALGAVTATGSYGAVAMLDALNKKISTAANDGPVTVGGTTYASVRDFWTYKRDSYLSDSSSDGFFTQLSTELKNESSKLASKNSLDTGNVQKIAQTFDKLAARSELQNYANQIDLYKQDVLQSGANAVTTNILNEFARTLDVSKAVTDLTNVKNLGVNVDDAYTKILTSNAATKNSQVSGILQAAQQAMQNNPSLTPELAVQQAVKAGAGFVVSPTDAAFSSEQDLATKAVTTAAQDLGVNDPRTTAPNPTPSTPGNLNTSSLSALPNLQPGMSGNDVKTLQNYLIQQGYQIPSGATGFYGPETTAAVLELQKKLGVDYSSGPGYFGPKTKAGVATSSTPAPQPAPTPQQQTQPKSGSNTSTTTPKTTQPKQSTPAPQQQQPAPAPAPKPVTYTIKYGDTLSAIAARNGTTVSQLAALNGIKDPNKIQAGATIKIK